MQTVTTTNKAPFHKPNIEIQVNEDLATKMVKNGWAVMNAVLDATPAEATTAEATKETTEVASPKVTQKTKNKK